MLQSEIQFLWSGLDLQALPPPETFSPAVIWCGVAPFFAQKNYFYDLDHFYWPWSHLFWLYVTNILVNMMPD